MISTTSNLRSLFLTSSILIASASVSSAATLLSIDFGTSAVGNTVQSGFVSQTADNITHSTIAGDINVSFTGESGFFSRGETASTETSLHDDFVFRNGGATFTMVLSGAGIAASTNYELTLWAWDGNSAADQTFIGVNDGVNGTFGSAAINFTNTPKPADLTSYSVTETFTSDSLGVITIDITDTAWTSGDAGRLNGLVIAAVPEPSAFGLLSGAFAFTWIMLRRRRA